MDLSGTSGLPPPDLIASCYSVERNYQRGEDPFNDYSFKEKKAVALHPAHIATESLSDRDSWVVIHDWFSLHKVREVENSLITLQCSVELHIVTSTLEAMVGFFDDDEKLGYLVERKAHTIILQTMGRFGSCVNIQNLGCSILKQMVNGSEECKWEVQYSPCYRHLLDILKQHSSNEDLSLNTIGLLIHIVKSEDVRRDLARHGTVEGLSLFTQLVHTFQENQDIALGVCNIIGLFLEDALANHHGILDQDTANYLIEGLKPHLLHTTLSQAVISIVEMVLYTAPESRGSCRLDFHTGLIELLKVHIQRQPTPEILQGILYLLNIFLDSGVHVANDLVVHDLCQIIFEVGLCFDSPPLVLECLRIVHIVGEIHFTMIRKYEEQSRQWLETLNKLLCYHRENFDIQELCCSVLAKLIKITPGLIELVGIEPHQFPIHSSVFGTILIYGQKDPPNVFSSACELIYWISGGNESIQELLVCVNAHEAILLGLNRNLHDSEACKNAAMAIRALIIFSIEYKRTLGQTNCFSLLMTAYKTHRKIVTTVEEILATIGTLLDDDIARNQFLVEEGDKLILNSMKLHGDSRICLEVALETLASLYVTDAGPSILAGHGALQSILRVMGRHRSSEMIQMKAMVNLQFLVNVLDFNSSNVIDNIAKSIISSMKKHKTSYGVQIEGTVVFLTLAKLDPQCVSKFLQWNIIEIICDNVDYFQEFDGLKEISMFAVAEVLTHKDQVLQLACANGYTVAAECMVQLGADVNVGHGFETPLCHACTYQNTHMISVLLQENVHDLRNALKLALGLRNNDIIGNLLYHIGHDREAGTLSWCGIDLKDLQSEWLAPTLLGTGGMITIFSEISKNYTERIRCCLELSLSSGDTFDCHFCGSSSSGEIRRPPFRFEALSTFWRQMVIGNRVEDFDADLSELASHENKPCQHSKESFVDNLSRDFSRSGILDDYAYWKQSTISGANAPTSRLDPRLLTHKSLSHMDTAILGSTDSFPWGRKGYVVQRNSTGEENSYTWSQYPLKRCVSEPKVLNIGQCPREVSRLSCRWKSLEGGPALAAQSNGNSRSECSMPSQYRCHGAAPNTLSGVTPIRTLDVSNNGLRDLVALGGADEWLLERLCHLTALDVSRNKLRDIPTRFLENLCSLEILNLVSNQLSEFPAIDKCTRLKILNVSDNKISGISITRCLPCLRELNLEKNALAHFPVRIAEVLPNLCILNLSRNCIGMIPDQKLHLGELHTLNIAFNRIKSLPETFLSATQSLKILNLKGNQIGTLPSENVALDLKNLLSLDLSHNELGDNTLCKSPFYLPRFVVALPSLKYINISHNRLSSVPGPNLWASTNIRELNFSYNHLTNVPLETHAKLWGSIEKLNLSNNQLVKIPKAIGLLSNLTSLNISHNPFLTSIPDDIGKLSRLWEFGLEGLSLDLDSSLLRGRTKDLIGYLHEKLKKSVEFNHMKLMLVGYGGRGKSTLLRALMKQRQQDKALPTVGVVVKTWRYAVWKKTSFVTYTLSCWDFAGQEDFYSKHEYFLSNRAVYLVVYDLSRGVSELGAIKPWLVNIYASAPRCPVIMVGTHRDLVPEEKRAQVIQEIRMKICQLSEKPGYPEIRGMVELCCTRESLLLEKLRIIIKQTVDSFQIKGLHVMGQKIPASYIRLQEILAIELHNIENGMPIANHDRVWKLVQEAGLDLDEEELQQAVRFLHEAGVVMHYEDTSMRLSRLYFLDPEWLCRMMAQIVTIHEINPFINQQGIMKQKDLTLLFTGKIFGDHIRSFIFPPAFIPYYLKLLERFQIAMPLNDTDLLIPSKLPDSPPVYSLPVNGMGGHEGACMIRRQYLMQYIPFGFGTRLLIRLLLFVWDPLIQDEYGASSLSEIVYWRKGLYACFDEHAFFQVVCAVREDIHMLELIVPPTRHGARLMGHVVDHIDAIVEEWYPGLLEVTPLGHTPLERRVPCIQCSPGRLYVFSFDDLVKEAENSDFITCPNHTDSVPLSLLAPEVVVGDFEQHYQVKHEDLGLVQSPEFLLGDGSFGRVYKAKYHNQEVAVKVFHHGDAPLHTLLRQEATILQKLKHPSLLSMVGVAVRPWVLVIELAALGDLSNVIKREGHFSRILQHRIALQVAEGLEFLHRNKIVYRDMKPDNILVFSMSLKAVSNVKISDYGISRFSAPYGVLGAEGTPGYRAPEVLSGQPYRFQADVYSYGITLYKLLTRGKHPYKNAEYTHELDDMVLNGAQCQPFMSHGLASWPDMEDIITACLQKKADSRPKSGELVKKLSSADCLCLQYVLPVSRGLAVDCLAAMPFGEECVEVWLSCADALWSQISWMTISVNISEPTGTLFTDSRILCMQPVDANTLVVGTQSGRLWIFDVSSHKSLHALPPLGDAIVSLLHHKTLSGIGILLAGTADGQVAVYDTSEIHTVDQATGIRVDIGGPCEPVMAMCTAPKAAQVYVCAGSRISALMIIRGCHLSVTTTWDTSNNGGVNGVICSLALNRGTLCVIKRGSPVLEKWECSSRKLINRLRMDEYLERCGEKIRSHFEARILSSVNIPGSGLWLGTASGHVVLVDPDKLQPLVNVKRHAGPIRTIHWIPKIGYPRNYSAVVISGMGFVADGMAHNPDDGYLTFWDADFPHVCDALEDHLKDRHPETNTAQ